MVVNKRGQTVVYGFMWFAVIIVFALAAAPVLNSFVVSAMAPSSDTHVGLDCANASISKYDKAMCKLTDISLPFFIIGLIALAGIVLIAKYNIGGG